MVRYPMATVHTGDICGEAKAHVEITKEYNIKWHSIEVRRVWRKSDLA